MDAAGEEMPALEIAIGPEGGWAPAEEALFDANGWRAVTLGPRILRAETAAIAALAVVASCLDNTPAKPEALSWWPLKGACVEALHAGSSPSPAP